MHHPLALAGLGRLRGVAAAGRASGSRGRNRLVLLLLWLLLGRPVAMAVGTADVDAIHGIRWRVCRSILGSVLGDHVG